MIPRSRKEFEEYCLRALGSPVIEINVAPEQISDAIDDALLYWQTYHSEATEKKYCPYIVTEEDEKNVCLTIPEPIISIVSVINAGGWDSAGATLGNPIWHMKYDIMAPLGLTVANAAGPYPQCPYGNLTSYITQMERLSMYESLFNQAPRMIYYQHSNHLFFDRQELVKAGTLYVFEAYVIIDPEEYRDCWNDLWLKRYATALIGKRWAGNLSKYEQVQLPGGITLNASELFSRYNEEVNMLHEEIRSNFEYPPEFRMA